jgi:hypothetical protein
VARWQEKGSWRVSRRGGEAVDARKTVELRRPLGDAPFLVVREQQVLTPTRYRAFAQSPQANSLVEYRRVKKAVVLTLASGVTPLSQDGLLSAIEARRVLLVWNTTSSFGDRDVRLTQARPDNLPGDDGLALLFPAATGPTEEEVRAVGPLDAYDDVSEFERALFAHAPPGIR